MKTILYSVLFLIVPFSIFAQNSITVSADIRGRSCKGGLGLCSNSDFSQDFSSTDSKTISKYTLSKKDRTHVTFQSQISELSEDVQKSIFGTTFDNVEKSKELFFTQEVDIIIAASTISKLGIPAKYNTIKKGKYPISISEDSLSVLFSLTEN